MSGKDIYFSKGNSTVSPDLKFREIKKITNFLRVQVCVSADGASELFFLERPNSITAIIYREIRFIMKLNDFIYKIILLYVKLSFGRT